MKLARVLSFLVLALAGLAPAHAAGGGTTLVFNETLDKIQGNLTGPTANTVVVVLIVGGLIGMAVSRESAWMKTLGGLCILAALIAKAPALVDQLGIGGASATPRYWATTATAFQVALALIGSLVFLPSIRRAMRRAPRPTGAQR